MFNAPIQAFSLMFTNKTQITMSMQPTTPSLTNDNDRDNDNENEVFGTPPGSPTDIALAEDMTAPHDSGDDFDDALPLYLVKTLGRGTETINLDDVQEEMLEEGFGDSDNEADGVLDHNNAMVEATEE
jgi:hypothetical protein